MLNPPKLDSVAHKLLYVEDNEPNSLLVKQLVARRKNCELLKATDGELGLAAARIHHPEVIMMDINLPGMSGYDVLELLLADTNLAHIPVIALSSAAFPKDIEKGLQAGFFRYLTKPFKTTDLMDALDEALHIDVPAFKNKQNQK